MHKRFSILLIIRVLLLTTTISTLSLIFGDQRLFFNHIILGIIIIFQVTEMIRFVNRTNRELAKLFLAVRHSDFSITFAHGSLGKSFKELEHSFIEIIKAYKEVKIEKEAQFHFLQMLVNTLHVGIISLKNNSEVTLINPTAEELLGIKGIKNWKFVREYNPSFVRELELIGENGRRLVEVRGHKDTKTFSIDVTTLFIFDAPHKLITFQDINAEIEQKEIEAWHKLIRILTHEIMNSVTPISSLTETMQTMLQDDEGKQKQVNDITDEAISDILFSLKTIQKRSDRLLSFIDDYRKFSRVPKPDPETIELKELFDEVHKLMQAKLDKHKIHFSVDLAPNATHAWIDRTLIEQVLINLTTNSIHALDERPNREIRLSSYQKNNYLIIEVADTGKGIPEKELNDIFIPFFSTKKEGSGVGLSLSKQIISLHGGKITVQSVPDKGTSFYLHFLNRQTL